LCWNEKARLYEVHNYGYDSNNVTFKKLTKIMQSRKLDLMEVELFECNANKCVGCISCCCILEKYYVTNETLNIK
jgi:hypothetical protein